MPKSIDLLLDPATGDLVPDTARDSRGLVARGLAVGEVTAQNQALLLRAAKGEFKEFPTLGAGIDALPSDHERDAWLREITLQLEADGFRVRELDLEDERLVVEAEYLAMHNS